MTWILDEAELLLRSDKFSTVRIADLSACAFEDTTTFGFTIEYPDVGSLLRNWESNQATLLERFSPALRNGREKAWNVYNVLLTEQTSTNTHEVFLLETIEEDLRHTRKIPRQSVRTQADVRVALAPLLAIVGHRNLKTESFDARLARRLEPELGAVATKSFMGDADEETVARLLAERSQ